MSEINLKAQKRTELKKSISKSLRKKGFIPGIFYGRNRENIPIAISELSLKPAIFTSEFHIINLEIEGENEKYSCILKDVQFEPLKNKPIHFDLFELQAGEKISLEINVVLKGLAAGVKDGGVIQHSLHKLEIQCLPQSIPPNIEIDITNLGIGDSIKVSDVKIEGVEILNDENAAIVTIVPPAAEKAPEEETTEEEAKEPEVIAKGKKEEKEEES
ncbi:MAG: 50S ribosomal protein L25 [Ignavibacteria bacterium]|nr:50S ribosomal protein L25 [Ignavibacteria bacterium]